MKLLKPLALLLLLGVLGLGIFLVVRGVGKHERSTDERERLDKNEPSADQLDQQLIVLKKRLADYINQQTQLNLNNKTSQRVRETDTVSSEYTNIAREMSEVALKLAQLDPGSERAYEAIRLRMHHLGRGQIECDFLAHHYAERQHVAQLVKYVNLRVDSYALLGLLKVIIEKNPHMKDKSVARFTLAVALEDTEPDVTVRECEQLVNDLKGTNDSELKDIAARAAGLVFYHRQLAVGQLVLELEGKDADGRDFKLSDYRGKVILLHLWRGSGKYPPDAEFYAGERALVKRMEGRPFVLLGLHVGPVPPKVLLDRASINWRSFVIGPDDVWVTKWNAYHGNRFLVIDHRGKIVARNVGDLLRGIKFNENSQLKEMLNELVAEAEKNIN